MKVVKEHAWLYLSEHLCKPDRDVPRSFRSAHLHNGPSVVNFPAQLPPHSCANDMSFKVANPDDEAAPDYNEVVANPNRKVSSNLSNPFDNPRNTM